MSETVTQQAAGSKDTVTRVPEQTSGVQPDILEQLLKPEVQTSLIELVENLPKLTEMVSFLTKVYDFGMAVATDKVLIEDLSGGMKEFAKPVMDTVKGYASSAMEASDRAKMDHSTIGAFGLLRMLKDPQMQKMLHFMQAFLTVLSEKESAKQE